MLAVCLVPSSLRRAARCPAKARSKPSPPSSAAARPAVPIPVSFRNCRLEVTVSIAIAPPRRVVDPGGKDSPGLAGLRAELPDDREEPLPDVQLGLVQDPLEERGDHPADLGTRPDPELAHHIVPVDGEVVRGKGRAALDLPMHPGPEVLEGVHPWRPGAAADVVGAPQLEEVGDDVEADLPDEPTD